MVLVRNNIDNWPSRITVIEDVPLFFIEYIASMLKDSNEFPYTIYCPADSLGKISTTPKLFSLSADKLLYLERLDNKTVVKCFDLNEICVIEYGQILLYSWLKIVDSKDAILIEFNSVADRLFAPILKKIRCHINNIEPIEIDIKINDNFSFLTDLNYKFMVNGSYNIPSNIHIEKVIFQPSIFKQVYKIFKKRITEDLLIVTTDKELIIFSDEGTEKVKNTGRYGYTAHFYQLANLNEISFERDYDDEILYVSFKAASKLLYRCRFAYDQAPQLSELKRLLKQKHPHILATSNF